MQIPLPTSSRKFLFLAASGLGAVLYIGWCGRAWLAMHYAAQPDLHSLEKAAQLTPGNAEYQYLLGSYYLAVQSPQQAKPRFLLASSLNPHRADYWFSLANVQQLLGDNEAEKSALEHAIQVDPTTPNVAWQAANFYLAQDDEEQALREFRIVLESGSYRIPDSIRLSWQIKPDADYLVQSVLPPNPDVYFALLDYLQSRNEDAAAANVWTRLAQLNQPLEQRRVFEYMRYLLNRQDAERARLVWQQSAPLCALSAYQPSPDNLVINGDFSLPILNAGFDWHYNEVHGIELALDPTQAHAGHRSLSISFDSSGLDDSGIWQEIALQPNTRYEFSANFKAPDMQGAGGPQFVIEDAVSGAEYLATDNLKDADFWRQVGGTFTSGPNANLVTLRIRRVPAGNPIRGKLWIDGVRLKPAPETAGKISTEKTE